MARLEPANWTSLDVSMALNGAIAMPEAFPLSPTDSVDSAIGHSPRPPGNTGKYLTYGGPGFSVGSLDAVKGNDDRIPVPIPRVPSCAETTDFTQSTVQCAAAVGENQVWVGTESGSLHVFELNRDCQFSSHAFTTLDSSVLCILPRYASLTDSISEASMSFARSSRIDILIGSSSGVVTIIAGDTNQRGGLRDPDTGLRRARKVLHLESETEEEGGSVHCVAAVSVSGRETFWCGYRKKIVVLRRGDWEEIDRLDGTLVLSNKKLEQLVVPDKAEVVKLLGSEQGVWCALSFSSSVSLWDTDTLKPKLSINCCSFCAAELPMADIPQLRAIHFSYPYLLVGTSKGDLIVFHIQSATPSTQSPSHLATPTQPQWDYRVVTAEHCTPSPILDIFAMPPRLEEDCRSPFSSTSATPTSLQVLVVCGQNEAKEFSASRSQILLYELVTSPSASPLNSPRPLSSLDQRSASVTGYQSVSSSSSLSLRRRSLGVIPKLTFHSVSRDAFTLLPLRST